MRRAKRNCGLRIADCGLCNPRWSCRGQSTLEYILVLAAILVAVILGANQLIKPAVEQALTDSKETITDATKKLRAGLGLPQPSPTP